MSRRTLAALALSVLFLTSAQSAASLPRQNEEWIELETPNFTLYSNAGRANTERIATNLERFRTALTLLTPDLSLSSPYPTSIFVFKSASSLEPYQRVY